MTVGVLCPNDAPGRGGSSQLAVPLVSPIICGWMRTIARGTGHGLHAGMRMVVSIGKRGWTVTGAWRLHVSSRCAGFELHALVHNGPCEKAARV